MADTSNHRVQLFESTRTASLSGLPGEDDDGVYDVSVTLSDGDEHIEHTFQITVNSAIVDSDGDGIMNREDLDDDNDGMSDLFEDFYRFNRLDPSDAAEDADGDGASNLREFNSGTNPRDYQEYPGSVPAAVVNFLLF